MDMQNQFSIIDNHGRPINYLRLAVTDRCNLRCFYCMPVEGITYLPKKALLSYEEMEKLIRILATMGITKVRITGGEPFVRRDLIGFLERITQIEGIHEVHLTTNGVFTAAYIPALRQMGISSVNLSLDALDRERFYKITRRDNFEKVMDTFHQLLDYQIPTKINAVIMGKHNTEDIIPLALLTEKYPVSVRYIEEMPFNGEGKRSAETLWNYCQILQVLQNHFPSLQKTEDDANSTSINYKVSDHAGTIGIIPAFSRTFCGSCNRIRITAQGTLKTCLYDEGVLDLKALLRGKVNNEKIKEVLVNAFQNRAKDGFEAEEQRKSKKPAIESMSTIGG